MLLVALFSLFSMGFGMRVVRRGDDQFLELGPLVEHNDDDDLMMFVLTRRGLADAREKRGVDPLSIPRLIKEPPLKKRSDFKRGDVVYPSAAKQTVPLVRVREPPLKRGQLFLEDFLQLDDNKRIMEPNSRIRYGSNRHIYSW
uniref:Uncharacterized protein n=1 Tax=Caenorhabditis japonica TaxID=281687 RepID=A0A8R1E1D0_CAEJA